MNFAAIVLCLAYVSATPTFGLLKHKGAKDVQSNSGDYGRQPSNDYGKSGSMTPAIKTGSDNHGGDYGKGAMSIQGNGGGNNQQPVSKPEEKKSESKFEGEKSQPKSEVEKSETKSEGDHAKSKVQKGISSTNDYGTGSPSASPPSGSPLANPSSGSPSTSSPSGNPPQDVPSGDSHPSSNTTTPSGRPPTSSPTTTSHGQPGDYGAQTSPAAADTNCTLCDKSSPKANQTGVPASGTKGTNGSVQVTKPDTQNGYSVSSATSIVSTGASIVIGACMLFV